MNLVTISLSTFKRNLFVECQGCVSSEYIIKITNLVLLVSIKSGVVLCRMQIRDDLGRADGRRNFDGPRVAILGFVVEERWFSALSAGVLVGPLGDGDRATLRRMEPVEVSHTGSSSVPALGARTENTKHKVAASSSSVSLALGATREAVELCWETEPSGERAADGAAVAAPEGRATASDSAGVSTVVDGERTGGDGDESDKAGEYELHYWLDLFE